MFMDKREIYFVSKVQILYTILICKNVHPWHTRALFFDFLELHAVSQHKIKTPNLKEYCDWQPKQTTVN